MGLPSFLYLAPRSLKEALELLGQHKHKITIIAGGTDIIDRIRKGLVDPVYVMSLKEVLELTGIRKKENEIVISANTTLRDIAASPSVEKFFKSLAVAARLVAAPPIQNVATIGGNLLQNSRCLFYNQSSLVRKAAPPCIKQGGKICLAANGGRRCFSVYQGDIAPSLIALDATAVLQNARGKRNTPVYELFTHKGDTPLSIKNDELLTDIIIPIPRGPYASSYQKLRLRSGLDYPLASSSAFISLSKNGVIEKARVVTGAVGPAPLLVEKASLCLMGTRPDHAEVDQAAEYAFHSAQTINNLGLPGAYRKKMLKVFAKRAIESALGDFQKAGMR